MLVSTATKPSMISSLSLPQVIDFAVSSGCPLGFDKKKKTYSFNNITPFGKPCE